MEKMYQYYNEFLCFGLKKDNIIVSVKLKTTQQIQLYKNPILRVCFGMFE